MIIGKAVIPGGSPEPIPIPDDVNDATWKQISEVAMAGTGDTYWDIGDCKEITLNGTVGTSVLNNVKLCVFILDFNHPINKATADNNIIWGGFKTSTGNDGVDVALVGNGYNYDFGTGEKYFDLNHWGSANSPYNTNYGGWKGSDFRYDILGGTSTAPSVYGSIKTTSCVGYDATQATIDTPVANTLMAALPSDLRTVLRLWNRYIDYKGNSSNIDDNCSNATVDAISLLSEFEVSGSRSYANSYEQNHQKQMTYYSNGNSKIKYKYNDTNTACHWFVASPVSSSNSNFCRVAASGASGATKSSLSSGIAPAFRT